MAMKNLLRLGFILLVLLVLWLGLLDGGHRPGWPGKAGNLFPSEHQKKPSKRDIQPAAEDHRAREST
jgi:hypothetical protein